MDEFMDGWMDEFMDGWMDGVESCVFEKGYIPKTFFIALINNCAHLA
jgi:hypothetical protein